VVGVNPLTLKSFITAGLATASQRVTTAISAYRSILAFKIISACGGSN